MLGAPTYVRSPVMLGAPTYVRSPLVMLGAPTYVRIPLVMLGARTYIIIPRFLPPPPHLLRTVCPIYSILVAQTIMGCLSMMSLVTSPMIKQLKWPFYHRPVMCKHP